MQECKSRLRRADFITINRLASILGNAQGLRRHPGDRSLRHGPPWLLRPSS